MAEAEQGIRAAHAIPEPTLQASAVDPSPAEKPAVAASAIGRSAAGVPPPTDPAIVVRDLTHRYGDRLAVDRLAFDVPRGQVFALLGPNGAGKTTTVEILEGYRVPTAGAVRVLGLDPVRDAARLKPRIGLMLQEGGVYPSIRPLEALRLFASFYPDPRDPVALLGQLGLDDAVGTTYRALSGGQKARLSLALALVGRPELVFLDEPTAAMDPQARRATWEIVRGLRADGVTVLLTTHSMEEVEALADRVAIVDRGRLVALDAPATLGRLVALDAPAAPGRHPGVHHAEVGEQQVAHDELRFRAPPGLPLPDLATRIGARELVEERPGEYRAALPVTPATVAHLTAWLAERDVLLADLRVGRQSLEDIFLRLTGPGNDRTGPAIPDDTRDAEAEAEAAPNRPPVRVGRGPRGRDSDTGPV